MRADDNEMAELRARAASNDHLRVGGPVSFKASMTDDPDIGPDREVNCASCGKLTPISGFAWWCAKVVMRGLLEKGEKATELERHIMRCPPCQALNDARLLERSFQLAKHVAAALRRAREDPALEMPGEMITICRDMRRVGEHEAAMFVEAAYHRRRVKASGDSQAGPGRRGGGRGRHRGGLDESVE